MKNRISKFFLVLISLFLVTGYANGQEFELTIKLNHPGIRANFYRLGEELARDIKLADSFKELDPLSLDDLIADKDSSLANKIQAIIARDKIEPDYKAISQTNKEIELSLRPGIYLIQYEKKTLAGQVISYKASYLAIESSKKTIEAKYESYPEEELGQLELIKIWEDDDQANRPDHIYIRLYQNQDYIARIKLSSKDNWRRLLTNLDSQSDYWIIEEEPIGYWSSIEIGYNRIYIINRSLEAGQDPDYQDKDQIDIDQDLNLDKALDLEKGKDLDLDKNLIDLGKKDENLEEKRLEEDQPGLDEKLDSQKDDRLNLDDDLAKAPAKKLPQTGLLWWPVAFLISLGLIFLALYIRSKSHEKNE